MPELIIEKARSGADTCSYNGKRLHSAYDPQKEARRFSDDVRAGKGAEWVLVTEPALSYCAAFLRGKFPGARLAAVRYSGCFSFCDDMWDAVFDGSLQNPFLDETLYSRMGEEGIARCAFASWKPSESAFPEEYAHTWQSIRSAVEKSRSVYATREFFGPLWAKNAVRFCTSVKNTALIRRGDAPIVIAASGPSLAPVLPFLRERRQRFFLIAVSSALMPLEHAGIVPDLCISTDGGWWAQKHIERTRLAVPFALAAEASAPSAFFSERTIVPLRYGDSLEGILMDSCGIPSMPACRNGTVSGTAVEFALSISSGAIYCCGLDMESGDGLPHSQPNALEQMHAANDNALRPLQTRAAPAALARGSMETYRAWFESNAPRIARRVARLCAAPYRKPLGTIADLPPEAFLQREADRRNEMPRVEPTKIALGARRRLDVARELLSDPRHHVALLRELFPVEALHPETLESASAEKFHAFMRRMRRYIEP